jgi:pteridine reductase
MAILQVALITGSGRRRLGWHIARALAARGYGLALHYRSAAVEANQAIDEFHKEGVNAIAVQADLSHEAQVGQLIQTVLAHFGRIDVLVNAASVWHAIPLEKVTADDVRRHFDANVLGTFLCSQQAGLAMVHQPEGGCIINFGDWAEARPYRNYSAYFATKGAVPVLTRCLAVELGTRNPRIRVNAILPGPVMLPADLPEAERQQAIAATLVQREGRPDNIVQSVLYLIDNDFVTGSCLSVDGGRTVFAGGS